MVGIIAKKTLEQKIKRRDFFEIAARAAGAIAIGSIPIINAACGKKDSPEGPAVPVTLQFEVYNLTEGYRTSFARNIMSGQNVNIKISDLRYNDVDSHRIAVREKNMGPLANFSATGEANFTAPGQNMNYDVILFNASNNAHYQWMDDQNSGLYMSKRNYAVFRRDFDGQTGPEEVWANVFYQLNAALDLGWVKLGSIYRQPSSGDFSYGYGDSFGHAGVHAGAYITVNSKIGPDEGAMTTIGLAEAFENICKVQNIGGDSSWHIICPNLDGVLNHVGRDLFAYVFAKDSAR